MAGKIRETKILRDNGLTLALTACFLLSVAGMLVSGWMEQNNERVAHKEIMQGMAAYAVSGEFLSALFENWESEFLQMATYVAFTAYLFQRGSSESLDPDHPGRPHDVLRPEWRGVHPIFKSLYSYSLGIALALLFLASFVFHALATFDAANDWARQHGQPAMSFLSTLAGSRFWFESFQNWQSEFLSTAVLIVLSIFLRFKGSPESKPLGARNSETGA
jgi:hypothetical protein